MTAQVINVTYNMVDRMFIVTIMNTSITEKGIGTKTRITVGKSMVTSLLASAMQKKGYQCTILDVDVTGPSIPRMFGIRKKAVSDETGILPAETKDGMKILSSSPE